MRYALGGLIALVLFGMSDSATSALGTGLAHEAIATPRTLTMRIQPSIEATTLLSRSIRIDIRLRGELLVSSPPLMAFTAQVDAEVGDTISVHFVSEFAVPSLRVSVGNGEFIELDIQITRSLAGAPDHLRPFELKPVSATLSWAVSEGAAKVYVGKKSVGPTVATTRVRAGNRRFTWVDLAKPADTLCAKDEKIEERDSLRFTCARDTGLVTRSVPPTEPPKER